MTVAATTCQCYQLPCHLVTCNATKRSVYNILNIDFVAIINFELDGVSFFLFILLFCSCMLYIGIINARSLSSHLPWPSIKNTLFLLLIEQKAQNDMENVTTTERWSEQKNENHLLFIWLTFKYVFREFGSLISLNYFQFFRRFFSPKSRTITTKTQHYSVCVCVCVE